MRNQYHRDSRPGLLVSVRNAAEAREALAGGAQVIDVKEPDRGALGAADAFSIWAVIRAAGRRVPVTVAWGELTDLISTKREPVPTGVSLFKIGLSDCRKLCDWRSHWVNAIAASGQGLLTPVLRSDGTKPSANATLNSSLNPALPQPVAVAYADWRAAGAPEPAEVAAAAVHAGCPALLVDTWDKSLGCLFDHWRLDEVGRFVQTTQSQGLIVVLAGSLAGESLMAATRLKPDVVGVRAAACEGGRRGRVSAERVRGLQHSIRLASGTATFSPNKIFS